MLVSVLTKPKYQWVVFAKYSEIQKPEKVFTFDKIAGLVCDLNAKMFLKFWFYFKFQIIIDIFLWVRINQDKSSVFTK